VVFNSGQYVQWTCPWDYLGILMKYRDRDGKTFYEWECKGRNKDDFPNWSHVYSDLATLKFRRGFSVDKNTFTERIPIQLLDIYFPHQGKSLLDYDSAKYLVGFHEEDNYYERNKSIVEWVDNLIQVGWYLCSSI
jgi:CRISPR-associated protein Cmr2